MSLLIVGLSESSMLSLATTFSATTLTANPGASLGLVVAVSDTDTFITSVGATIDWGDGQTDSFGPVAAPYGPVTWVHSYTPGVYQVRVTARNYKTPTAATTVAQQAVTVLAATRVASDTPAIVFGPILPRVQGSPSADSWNFNLGRDGFVLESSLLMLFLTACGERVYDRDYGSNLRQLIFMPDDADLVALARQEVARASAAYEPRVELVGVSTSRVGTRGLQINAEFISRLSRQPLVLNLAYAV